jgi:hypothetical protein
MVNKKTCTDITDITTKLSLTTIVSLDFMLCYAISVDDIIMSVVVVVAVVVVVVVIVVIESTHSTM